MTHFLRPNIWSYFENITFNVNTFGKKLGATFFYNLITGQCDHVIELLLPSLTQDRQKNILEYKYFYLVFQNNQEIKICEFGHPNFNVKNQFAYSLFEILVSVTRFDEMSI